AARFIFPRDRDRFIAGRGILRELLAAYLKEPAATVKFNYGSRGKPRLAPEAPGLRFNLSHSDGIALYAITKGREVGIDVERIRPDFGGMAVAERFFSARERADLHALPEDSRANGFFLCWTEKEAYVKALGDGLHIPLDSFDVSLAPPAAGQLRAPDGVIWTLHSFQPATDFIAAVAGEGTGWQPRFLKYRGSS
ncbi:MAG: 4'-phosphopantetheinyl transferase family protein, partial [Terriglobia bacterium]